MRKYTLLVLFCLLTLSTKTLHAQHEELEGEVEHGEADMFVHPFFAHMGLPDVPNEVSLRISVYQTREDKNTERDLAIHIEAGLLKNLGLHIRTDGIQHAQHSEVMLQYAIIADDELHNGISIFGQVSIPTGAGEEDSYEGLFGVSARLTLPDIVVWDGNVHYDPKEKIAEYEISFVIRGNNRYYPILEIRGHINGKNVEAYILPGLKFRIGEHRAFGVGIQTAISEHRDYDIQALFTYDVSF